MAKSTFEEVKTRTARAEAFRRERIVMAEMDKLLGLTDEEEFSNAAETVYGIMRGSPKHEQLLAIWRETSASR